MWCNHAWEGFDATAAEAVLQNRPSCRPCHDGGLRPHAVPLQHEARPCLVVGAGVARVCLPLHPGAAVGLRRQPRRAAECQPGSGAVPGARPAQLHPARAGLRPVGALHRRGGTALRRARALGPRGDTGGIQWQDHGHLASGRDGADAGDAGHLRRAALPLFARRGPL